MLFILSVALLGLIVLRVVFDRFDGFEVMMCFLVLITLRALQNLMV